MHFHPLQGLCLHQDESSFLVKLRQMRSILSSVRNPKWETISSTKIWTYQVDLMDEMGLQYGFIHLAARSSLLLGMMRDGPDINILRIPDIRSEQYRKMFFRLYTENLAKYRVRYRISWTISRWSDFNGRIRIRSFFHARFDPDLPNPTSMLYI